MVDEKDERYEGDESEYHFSDEEGSYDELETPKGTQPLISDKESLLTKLSKISSRRRIIAASVVFVVLMVMIYKMLSPSPAKMQIGNALPAVAATPVTPPKTAPTVTKVTPPTPVTPPAPQVAAAPVVTSPPVEMPPVMATQQPVVETPPVMVTQQPVTPPVVAPVVPPPVVAAAPTAPPPAPEVQPVMPNKNVVERVSAVEQQNTAMMNLLQNEYAQKMSEYEMQNNLMRSKMDEMAKRLSRMESTLNEAAQSMQPSGGNNGIIAGGRSSYMGVPPQQGMVPEKAIEPKLTYTVQAIIPGRAWLKSESGDTVTVAEGDLLKNYGRVMKIDPYDGVVEIDTGNRMISLSYGMSVE